MKSVLSLLLTFILIFSFCACNGNYAQIDLKKPISLPDDGIVKKSLIDDIKEENAIATIESTETKATFDLKDVHLWHGRKDPYLYCVEVEIVEGDAVIDNVCTRFGCRSFKIDPNNGFI